MYRESLNFDWLTTLAFIFLIIAYIAAILLMDSAFIFLIIAYIAAILLMDLLKQPFLLIHQIKAKTTIFDASKHFHSLAASVYACRWVHVVELLAIWSDLQGCVMHSQLRDIPDTLHCMGRARMFLGPAQMATSQSSYHRQCADTV